jgi:hypothetical protein
MFSDKRMNSIIFLVIQNHNGAGRCAAERRCVAKFLAAEGVYSFEIHWQLSDVIKENSLNLPRLLKF